MLRTHKDLDVWRKALDFVTKVYSITGKFPKEEVYGITSQIRRAAISIPSNIAEGAVRNGKKEFKNFLYIALASASELETQLIISNNLKYLKGKDFEDLLEDLNTISKMIQGLIKSVNK